jgi:hypothetical protein
MPFLDQSTSSEATVSATPAIADYDTVK